MVVQRKGQGAALAVSAPPPRTPERQALADAIAARDHVAAVIAERRAMLGEMDEGRSPLYDREREIEQAKLSLPVGEGDRLGSLLAREDPDQLVTREKLEREAAQIREQITASWDRSRRAEADVRLLEEDHAARVRDIERAAGAVIRSDPAVAAVMAEFEAVAKRAAILRRACGTALNHAPPGGGYLPAILLAERLSSQKALAPGARHGATAQRPDAVLPMPEDV